MNQFAKSYVRVRQFSEHAGAQAYTPTQLARIYGFPNNLDGTGQTVAFIELGGGFVQTDLDQYFRSLGLNSPPVKFVSVDGGTNHPTTANSADAEVMLDLCVTIGLANGIKPVVYGAPNTQQGFIDAVNKAISDGVDAISISWGAPEKNWNATGIQGLNSAFQRAASLGIVVTAAAGDNGSSDGAIGNNADFPASSPYVLACGGTSLVANNANAVISETVWNNGAQGGATGGGVSSVFALPTWQRNAGVPGGTMRGLPDVAAVADPQTGITVIVDGKMMVMGGTSAVAPFWAAVVAILNQGLRRRVGFLNPLIYASNVSGIFRDITVGNNGTYVAKTGWDACTGLGVPQVTNLFNYLLGPSSSSSSVSSSSSSSPTSSSSISSSSSIAPLEIVVNQSIPAGTYTLTRK